MTTSLTIFIGFNLFCLVIGMWLGTLFTNKKWSDNADAIQRLEYNGRLYKVTRE